ncbi:U5 small nuclear ribonucleoprotein TSSC4 [Euwallacea fornicatus]|uniref:U5 small nuclear ribonucleoprotein TSSC4 n=1 Tax=Euwallacea fornicatus TaxID=995702 RepID=UPI00338F16B0
MSIFKLKFGDPNFNDRHKKVFDQLLVLENNRMNITYKGPDKTTPKRKDHRSETKHFRGKESMFKKPQNPAPKNYILRLPDFKKNPHKWTKYSLEDVQEMTDESNTKSAMDFLKQLANRRKLEEDAPIEEKLEELPSKIVFNKHVTETKNQESIAEQMEHHNEKPSYSNGKLVMPEYVIGQMKKDKKVKRSKPEKGLELKLGHLEYDDE